MGMLKACGDAWRLTAQGIAAAPTGTETLEVDAAGVKKHVELVRHTVTKLGAAATSVDPSEVPTLEPVCDDVLRHFLALAATLEALVRNRPGQCWRDEVSGAGGSVAAALEALGATLARGELTNSSRRVGDVLERLKRIERVSTSQAAAVRKVVLTQVKQMRDARRELTEALAEEAGAENAAEDEEDEDDLFDMGGLDPEQRARAAELDRALGQIDAAWAGVAKSAGAEDAFDISTLDALAEVAVRCGAAVDAAVAHLQMGDEAGEVDDLRAAVRDLQALVPTAEIDLTGC